MTQIDRRQALQALGSVGLGALLAACSRGGAAGTTTVTTATVTTEDGSTTTVQPQTTTSAGLASLFDESAACTLTPELTEGPYYFDVDSIRSDIREDREGTTLRLALRVRDAVGCEPISNAVVEIWHCDALGIYSGFELASQGGGGSGRTDEETYLRGAQVSNGGGIVEFVTVYPGWYRGRTTHIHVKVHPDGGSVVTTQLFFAEDVTAQVYATEPYVSDAGRDTVNDNDGIFDERLILSLSPDGDGWLGVMTFDVEAV